LRLDKVSLLLYSNPISGQKKSYSRQCLTGNSLLENFHIIKFKAT
jgi:hypothetical protein